MADSPGATNEARMRWVQRGGDPISSPADYWSLATALDNHGLDADEARYLPSHEVVLVCKNDSLTTVLDASPGANLRGETRDAISEAARTHEFAEPGGGGTS